MWNKGEMIKSDAPEIYALARDWDDFAGVGSALLPFCTVVSFIAEDKTSSLSELSKNFCTLDAGVCLFPPGSAYRTFAGDMVAGDEL